MSPRLKRGIIAANGESTHAPQNPPQRRRRQGAARELGFRGCPHLTHDPPIKDATMRPRETRSTTNGWGQFNARVIRHL